jgi:hypothetical protein
VQGSPADIYVDALLRSSPSQANRAAAAAEPTRAQAATQANDQATSPAAAAQNSVPLQGGQITPAPQADRRDASAQRGEITRSLVPGLAKGGNVSDTDRDYLAQVVSARTGLHQAEARQRVDQVVTQAKAAVDAARKSAAKLALWLVVSMLAGALSASLAAIEGGSLRNREWYLTADASGRVVAAE